MPVGVSIYLEISMGGGKPPNRGGGEADFVVQTVAEVYPDLMEKVEHETGVAEGYQRAARKNAAYESSFIVE